MKRYSFNFIVTAVILVILSSFSPLPSYALSYQYGIDVQFTFNPTISVSLSSADLIIPDLAPGTASDSNTITINVLTNTAYGYTLTASVGNDTTFNTRNLVHSNTNIANTFSSIDYGSSIATNTDLENDTWGYSYKDETGITQTWSSYSGLPLYSDTTNIATLKSTTTPVSSANGDDISFKIAARASSLQASGEYNNVINFAAIATPEPTPQPIDCPANTICYAPNALDVTDTMGDQENITSGSDVMLWPSNFQRSRHGFAGWNTELDGSGTKYGPMETITTGDLDTKGLSLYAMWIETTGYMQNWDGCNSLNIGDVTALGDLRDDNVYAVAKLADGNCWMIENLRLDNTNSDNATGNLAQGYASNFHGLADPEGAEAIASTVANSLYSTDGGNGTFAIAGDYQNQRFPRYNNDNTANPVAYMTTPINANIYSYGNYYTWAAAMADTDNYYEAAKVNEGPPNTSICPTGWHIPAGDWERNWRNGEWFNLNVAVNNGSDSSDDGLRTYPNNFIYSGGVSYRGTDGAHISSTTGYNGDTFYAIPFTFYADFVKPGIDDSEGSANYEMDTVRCILSS